MSLLLALLSGLVFGLGLIASGMTDPQKVKAFLDLSGAWDPSLALVMVSAIAVGLVAVPIALRRRVSMVGGTNEWPLPNRIDRRLVLGGALFGAGWGIGGFCPGPALVALGSGFAPALVFVLAMLAGMAMHDGCMAPTDQQEPLP